MNSEYFYWIHDPVLLKLTTNAVHSLIGFIYGMSLVYVFRMKRNRLKMWIIPVVAAFYVAVWGLEDFELIRRLIIVLVLIHIATVGVSIMFENQSLANYVKSLRKR